ncbi:MAG: tetraacyldisaccharide 4'-kinase [Chitinophagales bacterium]|nr:tetraacyldisaccharide 4'-kinase [Chitinophagales bacterium]MBP8753439.1 tetraacyldisaccharide 4'-kinase [Chitinophagales bacterium]MBP9548857.1 tetraacyldisaccharide 4'-kinase [Chitinophagales bacterium]MBP9703140.1 tetraacyldisaccharide 4'-kinase [Chitinophagales bacterium]
MRILLLPFTWIYSIIIAIRNFFYDAGWLRSFRYDFPVICVGNLNTGGTGKTPHLIYIAGLLQNEWKGAVISRGYKRRTSGFVISTINSLVKDIGDEPKLIKQKMPQLEVAVCENRFIGISTLLQEVNGLEYILMDDGFQHRKVKAGYNIIITAYNDLFIDDKVLPAGNLREPATSLRRADTIIISKCPPEMPKREASELRTRLQLLPQHKLFFTTLQYQSLRPLFPAWQNKKLPATNKCLLISGIASDKHITAFLKQQYHFIERIPFADHHYYSEKDLQLIQQKTTDNKIVITTEKDAVRLMEQEALILKMEIHFYVLPVAVSFLFDAENEFAFELKDYIHREFATL